MKTICLVMTLLMAPLALMAQKVQFLHPQIIDMGEVPQGEVIEGKISFVNAGPQVLELESIKPSCGCTAVTPTRMSYARGDTALIPFSIKTATFQGPIRKTIKLTFKNGDPPSATIAIQAKITTDLVLSPRFINFGSVATNADTSFVEYFELANTSSRSITVTGMKTGDALITVTPETMTIPAGKSHLVQVHLKPQKEGRHNTQIQIETDQRLQTTVSLPVFVNVITPQRSGS